MLGVKAEQISATAEAAVPLQRAKALGKKCEENLAGLLQPLWSFASVLMLAGLVTPSKANKWFKPTASQIAKKKLEKQARQRAKQARFCAYSPCKVAGTMFKSPEYREVT